MSRLKSLFERKPKRVLNVYCTAGFPELNDTLTIMQHLEATGVDLIELGMPYSDPLADGPVIQSSSLVALKNGMTVKTLFEQLKGFRNSVSVPVVLMGYMNTVLQYGFEKFCEDAASVGVDGLILPDLPAYEFRMTYGEIIRRNGLDFIFLVTPETSDERVKMLDEMSSGFLYAVSSSSTTGKDKQFGDVSNYMKRLHALQLQNPLLVGFGIKDKQTFEAVQEFSNGAIIGSAFIQAIGKSTDLRKDVTAFINQVLA